MEWHLSYLLSEVFRTGFWPNELERNKKESHIYIHLSSNSWGYWSHPQEQHLSSRWFFGEQVLSHKSLDTILSPWFLLLMHEQCYSEHSTLRFQYVHKEEVGKKQSCALLCREKRVKQSFLHSDRSESRVLTYQTFWTRLKKKVAYKVFRMYFVAVSPVLILNKLVSDSFAKNH